MDLSAEQIGELLAAHGSPLMVISTGQLVRNYQALCEHLPRARHYYAVKANPHRLVLETLAECGAAFDVASQAELEQVLALGVDHERIIYTNPIKPFGAIEQATEKGIDTFVFDNESEIEKIAAAAPNCRTILRINVTNPNCVVDLGQKFGCPANMTERLLAHARERGLRTCGISFHVGSQTSIPQPYVDTLLECRNLFNREALAGNHLQVLDIGGGFPISYKNSEMPIEAFCEPIRAALDMYFPETEIWAEPGRFVCGPAATLLARIIGRENRNGVAWYYIEDGLYGSLSGCVFDHARYRFTSINAGEPRPCVIAGPTCDSFDVISRQEYLPDLAVGDVILAHDVGAYSNASATTFNGHPLTRVVAIP